jgi:hypothetical protein
MAIALAGCGSQPPENRSSVIVKLPRARRSTPAPAFSFKDASAPTASKPAA